MRRAAINSDFTNGETRNRTGKMVDGKFIKDRP
jgi:hypothetical protein